MPENRASARSRLLAAADRLFYAEGIHTVGIDRIIEEAGVAKGSLFYNFSGKEDLVAAYLAGRDERRRARTAQLQDELDDPADKLLAVFEVLHEAAMTPGYNGCPFANANAESAPDGIEAQSMRAHRGWLDDLMLSLAVDAGYVDARGVAARLRLLYDGAVAGSHLDGHVAAVELAKDMAQQLLQTAPQRDAKHALT